MSGSSNGIPERADKVSGFGYVYYPLGIRAMTEKIEAPIKIQIIIPSGTRYTVYGEMPAWGCQPTRPMIRERDQKRGKWA